MGGVDFTGIYMLCSFNVIQLRYHIKASIYSTTLVVNWHFGLCMSLPLVVVVHCFTSYRFFTHLLVLFAPSYSRESMQAQVSGLSGAGLYKL